MVNYVSEILMAYNDKLTDNKTIRKFFIEAFHMIILYRILESDRFWLSDSSYKPCDTTVWRECLVEVRTSIRRLLSVIAGTVS